MEVRELLDVMRLEEVGPQHRKVMLDQLGALFLDGDAASPEDLIVGCVVLRRGVENGLRFDHGLRRVVDPTEQIAVRMGYAVRAEETHRSPPVEWLLELALTLHRLNDGIGRDQRP